jgi:HK97 family phage portal protein
MADLKAVYQGQAKAGGNIVLPGGFKYTPIAIPPNDAQFLATRKFNVETVARWFGVPLEMIQSPQNPTYSSVEQNSISFLANTVNPILAKIELEYTNKLLSESYYTEFNRNAYIRTDATTKASIYAQAIQNGWMSQNDVRRLENMNEIAGGDTYWVQQNMMPIDKAEEILKGKNGESNGMEE